MMKFTKTIWLKANVTLLLGRNDDNETYKTHKETVPQGKVILYVLNKHTCRPSRNGRPVFLNLTPTPLERERGKTKTNKK
jgi:hypothetical protein